MFDDNATPKDIFDNTYIQMLNTTPSSMLPSEVAPEDQDLFDGVSKEILNLQDVEQKINDINTSLTNFEVKSNEWHDFLIQNKSELNLDSELFKSYEADEKATLESINRIKSKLLQISSEVAVLKSTLKQ